MDFANGIVCVIASWTPCKIKKMALTALITGATSGIGLATARNFADAGIQLIITGRRKERLAQIEAELSALVPTHAFACDVRDRASVSAAISAIPASHRAIDILVNNAGNAHGLDEFQDASLDDFDDMIDINVKGLLYVSKAIVPSMIDRGSGHIINIGSIAGKEVYPKGHVYCASKAAVDSITEGMRLDLHKHGIRVSAIHPGLVETEFSEVRFKGDQERAKAVYQGFSPIDTRGNS